MSENQDNKGCLRSLLTTAVRQVVLVILGIVMVIITLLNLYYSNVIEEACGLTHPLLFEISVDVLFLDDTEEQYSFGSSALPVATPPTKVQDERFTALF